MTAPAFDDDAFAMLRGLLREWGLSSLTGDIEEMLFDGVSPEVAKLRIRSTDSYKKRFKGNEAREKAGLPPLSEADYLATETALKNVLRRYGGEGSTISKLDVDQQLESWIGKDVSPQELNDRFSAYREQYVNQPQWVKDAWAQHGMTPWQAMMAAADTSVSEADLTTSLGTFAVGSEALQAYGADKFDFDSGRFKEYADRGVTEDRAREGFAEVAGREQYEGFIAQLSGTTLTREEQEKDALFGDGATRKKRERLLREDQGRFSENYLGGENALAGSAQGDY